MMLKFNLGGTCTYTKLLIIFHYQNNFVFIRVCEETQLYVL
jgi:hypothetical protein